MSDWREARQGWVSCQALARRQPGGFNREQGLAAAFGDVSGLASAVCDQERHRATKLRFVSLNASLQPVLVSADYKKRILLTCRELLRNAFTHAYPSNRSAIVGIHLWSAEAAAGLITHLLVADAGCGFDGTIVVGGGLARAQSAINVAGGTFLHEPGPGTIWRITLPFSSASRDITDAGTSLTGAPACH